MIAESDRIITAIVVNTRIAVNPMPRAQQPQTVAG